MHRCPECGYPNDPGDHRCERCGIRFDLLDQDYAELEAAVEGDPPEGLAREPWPDEPARPAEASPPVWHGEVAQRLASFRQRRHSLQAALPLEMPESAPDAPPPAPRGKIIQFPAPAHEPEPERARQPEPERVHVRAARPAPAPVRQQNLAFERPAAAYAAASFLDFPVASLRLRGRAATWDALMVAIGYSLLAVMYVVCGGHFPMQKITAVAAVMGMAMLPAFYHYLFLVLCAATPGMRREGLRLVDFNGHPAAYRQLRARAWAALFSAAPLLLGFLWAAVDQEKLTWHDRMSETCHTFDPPSR